MMILPTNSVERLDVRPVAPATLRMRTLPTRPHNTGIVPPWLLDGSELLPTQKIQK